MGSVDSLSLLDMSKVVTPAFLVDIDIAKKNASNMREKCQKLKVNLRPHMKTHKTL